jgi:Ca-activated chloride channel family protein
VRLRHVLPYWILAAAVLPLTAFAQLAPLRLDVRAAAEQPVVLRAVNVRTEIEGSLALTSVELRFFNPNGRQLEGELQFPLLDGQNMVGMAMDIDGRLREAVPVEKARGQQVFEDVTRANIDPALLSATQGNNYKLRVYPILPQREKVVVLRYAETLARQGSAQRYRLPLYYADRLPELSVAVRVVGSDGAPRSAAGGLVAPAFRQDGDAYVLDVARRDFTGKGTLEIDVPASTRPQAYTQVHDGLTYFHAEIPFAPQKAPRRMPRAVTLVWDSSGSGASRDHPRELALLNAYFAKARDVDVRLVRIRDAAEPAQSFKVTNGNWQALRTALTSTIYDGATSLGAFDPDSAKQEVLLFSDGLSNFGTTSMSPPRVPLYAISAAARSNGTALRHLAERSGGRFIDLVSTPAADAAEALLTQSSRILLVEADGASQLILASPMPGRPRTIAGILSGTRGVLRVTIGHPDGSSQLIRVPIAARQLAGVQAASMWARYRIDALEGDFEANRPLIRNIGKAFGLVTRETSLIVLDRVEDYARYEIAPPVELMAAYEQLRAKTVQREAADRKAHLDHVVQIFEEKQAWWDRAFPKDGKPKPIAVSKTEGDHRERRAAALADSNRPLPSAPAAAPVATAPVSAAETPARQAAQAGGRGDFAAQKNLVGKSGAIDAVTADAAATSIQLRRWTPDAPYIARLRNASSTDIYPAYLKERPGYADSTAFFLDAADVLFERGQTELAIRVLSNLAEMDLENRAILRILGQRLMQAHRPSLAVPIFRKVLALAPDEPQSYRDLGLAHAADGQRQQAIDALREVVDRRWNARFPEIELVALAELNAIVATSPQPLDVSRIDPRLLRNLPLALRVVMTWDADNTDIDLWVTDPNGERAYYGNRMSYQGGRVSPDFTGGYGPEEFSLKQAKPGKYKVEANYYGNRQQIVSGATTLQLALITGFGTAKQKEQSVTLRLKERQEVVFVGEFEVAAD